MNQRGDDGDAHLTSAFYQAAQELEGANSSSKGQAVYDDNGATFSSSGDDADVLQDRTYPRASSAPPCSELQRQCRLGQDGYFPSPPSSSDAGVESVWKHIPSDVMAQIMKCLPKSSIRVMRATCKSWNKAVGEQITFLKPDTLKARSCLTHFPNILILDLSSADIEYSCVEGSQDIQVSSGINDDDLCQVSCLQSLQYLYLNNCSLLRGSFFQSLRELQNLTLLDLSGCTSLSNEHFINCIQWFDHLESLSLVGCTHLRDSAVATVAKSLLKVKRLAVPPNITNIGLQCIATSSSIQRVGIRSCNYITPDGIKMMLSKMPHLQRLVVSKCKNISSTTLGVDIGISAMRPFDIGGDMEDQYSITADAGMSAHSSSPPNPERRRSINMELLLNYLYN
jgi:hypothetical protein